MYFYVSFKLIKTNGYNLKLYHLFKVLNCFVNSGTQNK